MEYTRLGTTGLQVSKICLGMMTYGDPALREWSLPLEEADPFVKHAIEGGINFFDTANSYSGGRSEEITGTLLRKYSSRDDVVVATKVFFPTLKEKPNGQGLGRKNILSSIDASLTRLQMDYVDLFQIHRFDPNTPVEETMGALHDVVRSGKARYIGASSMYAWQFAKAQRIARENGFTEFVSMQNHYNLIYREEEREMIPQCVDMRTAVIPWSPLARGMLAGTKTRDGQRLTKRAETDAFGDILYREPSDFDVVDRLNEVSAQRNENPATIALAWLLHKPGITAPIVGASKTHHLNDALKAVTAKLSPEEIKLLESSYIPHRIAGHQ
jgi:1-deoxyxylulose-5-phosphate synthase